MALHTNDRRLCASVIDLAALVLVVLCLHINDHQVDLGLHCRQSLQGVFYPLALTFHQAVLLRLMI